MIKFLHCADLHLDSPLAALPLDKAEVRRNEFRAAFTSMTLYARMNKIDLLFIAGDLFDSAYSSKDTAALIKREFENLPDCHIFISPGNHDPYNSTGFYKSETFSDNVHVFTTEEMQAFDLPELNVTVYGWAFTSERMEKCPLDGFSVERPDRLNFLVAHGDLANPDSPYCPISKEALANSGLDYAALGHIHARTEELVFGRTKAAYSGCLESRGFDETGAKGAIIGAAQKQDGSTALSTKFIRFSKRVYEIMKADMTGVTSTAEAAERVGAMINERHFGEDTALRLILTGNIPSSLTISAGFLRSRFDRLFLLEVDDGTLPEADAAALKRDMTIKGAYFSALEKSLESPDKEAREIAAMALRYGLAALSGGDVTDF